VPSQAPLFFFCFHVQLGETALTKAVYWGFQDVFDRLVREPGIKLDDADVVRVRPLPGCQCHAAGLCHDP
jgi:hypothetical protein